MVRLFLLAFLLLGFTIAAPEAAEDRGESASPRYGGTYRRPLANNPPTLDPHLISDTYGRTVAQQIFDGLVQYDGGLSIVPALAQSWKASRDGLEWTFYLRKGVKFHNGREVVADDVVYSFTRLIDPKTKSRAAEIFSRIEGARDFIDGRARGISGLEAVDRHTLRIKLAEGAAPFVASLAVGYAKIVPKEAVEEPGSSFGARPIGTGPFRFVHWKKDEEIVLEANHDYFGGRPFLDRLEYKIYPGHRTDEMLVSFQAGGLDDTFIPAAYWAKPREVKPYRFVQRSMLGVRFLGLTCTHPPLDNVLVRQAINYAIDKEALVKEILQGRFAAGKSFLPPGTYGWDPKYQPYPFDPGRARALLARAGYPGGKGLPVLAFWSSVKSADVEREHEAIRTYLSSIGVRAEFHYNTNWPTFNAQVREGKLPVFRYGWQADVPEPEEFLGNMFHSQSRNNLTRCHSAKVDRLLTRARQEPDYLKRITLYREVERLVMDESPVVPLNYYGYERLFQPYVQSIEVNALGDPYIPMRKVWLAR
jgi:peptide/nickel transport system substrate-binding protein/oligopeptide transport system substrate-binding protein